MQKLIFKNTNLIPYQYIELEGKKYIIDTSSVVGKRYYGGFLPENISVEMIEVKKNDDSFSIKSKTNLSTVAIALILQPFVKFTYDFMKIFFSEFNLSQQILLKILTFAFSSMVGYLIFYFYLKTSQKKGREKLPKEGKILKLNFKPNGKRMFSWYILSLGNVLCLYFFITITNGTEGALLFINSILTFFLFVVFVAITPIRSSYNNNEIFLTRIEEV